MQTFCHPSRERERERGRERESFKQTRSFCIVLSRREREGEESEGYGNQEGRNDSYAFPTLFKLLLNEPDVAIPHLK